MPSKKKAKGFRPTANPELAAAMHALRSSSAASPHTPVPKKGTRSDRKRRAIDEQRSS